MVNLSPNPAVDAALPTPEQKKVGIMAFVRVIGIFNDSDALERARSALIAAGLVAPAAVSVETTDSLGDPHLPRTFARWLHRLEELMPHESRASRVAHVDALRRGGQLLISTVAEEDAAKVHQIMRQHGAIPIERPVEPRTAGPRLGFELPPPLPEQVVEKPEPQPRHCIDERAAAQDEARQDSGKPCNVRLFDEASGREIGCISDAELNVLKNALEEEYPDDNDFWINPDEIEDLACRPGATPHLIGLLRRAVGDNPDGIDIAFQREGEPCTSLRGTAGSSNRGAR
jgi:hypothetical protein